MADFQYKNKCRWSKPMRMQNATPFEYKGMTFNLIPLKIELKEYEATGRTDKAEKIRKVLDC